jgi:hypothetical protein
MSKVITLASNQESRNSCRFCCFGTASHKVVDEAKAEAFYLCDQHYKEYQADHDDIQSNIDTRAEIAARKAAAEKEAAPSPAGKDEVQ